MPQCKVEGCNESAVATIVGEDGYAAAYRCLDCLCFDLGLKEAGIGADVSLEETAGDNVGLADPDTPRIIYVPGGPEVCRYHHDENVVVLDEELHDYPDVHEYVLNHELKHAEIGYDGDEHWKDQDECQGCGAEDAPLRAILLQSGERDLLCVGCFMDAFDEGRIHPDDARVDGNEAYIGRPNAPGQRGGCDAH